MRNFAIITLETILSLVMLLPRYRMFCYFKSLVLRVLGSNIGKRVTFYPGVKVMTGMNMIIGDDVDLARDVILTTIGGVEIGDRTLVGYRTQILTANHNIPTNRGKIFSSGHNYKPVKIGSDVWVGSNCIILPGVRIGEGAVIGAGSVVNSNIPAYSVAAGVPAKVKKMR